MAVVSWQTKESSASMVHTDKDGGAFENTEEKTRQQTGQVGSRRLKAAFTAKRSHRYNIYIYNYIHIYWNTLLDSIFVRVLDSEAVTPL